MSAAARYAYTPGDALGLARIETKLEFALATELADAPLLSATLRLPCQSAESQAIESLGKIIPPLSPLWWRTLGGVKVQVSEKPDAPVWLELEPA